MADPQNIQQYKYTAMSNLVLQHDRRFSTRRNDEVTGDPESLAGRINIRDMGARNTKDDVSKPKKKTGPKDVERGSIREGEDVLEREQRKRKRGETAQLRGSGILSAGDALVEDLKYRPRTAATRQTFDLILTTVARCLGDVPHEITRSAADAILELLKDENMKDYDKKKEVDGLLGMSTDSKDFNALVNLSKKITDYGAQDDDVNMDQDGVGDGADEAELDERQGVAVVFDESDEDQDDDGIARTYEVRDGDESSSDDEIDAGVEVPPRPSESKEAQGEEADEDEMVIDGGVEVGNSIKRQKTDHGQVPARDLDAYWLQRQVGAVYEDAHLQHSKTQDAMAILAGETEEGEPKPTREVENELMELFDYEHHNLVGTLIINRDKIIWVTRWRKAAEDAQAREQVEQEMVSEGHRNILDELQGTESTKAQTNGTAGKSMQIDLMDIEVPSGGINGVAGKEDRDNTLIGGLQPKRLINLENLVFDQGNHLMTNPNVKLPQGSVKRTFKGYEEIHVPAPKARKDASERNNMPTSELPEWARQGFGSSKELNRIQTKCFPTAFNDDGNMLICAPTGSGKTNVAMLAMLREIGKNRNPETGEIMLDDFKIIYIAPLKALVQEQVGNFGQRLKPYGIKVSELTGDRQLTKQQIADTQIIVTTPEKWDVITRKATDLSYTNLVRLVVIDEIHLLHDDRGPVLESIISRSIRKVEQSGDPVRIVGLSATLPNYRDVASFLRVDPINGLFHFDGSYRPCPLRQEFIGISEQKAIKQLKTMNDVCYTKVMEQVGNNKQQMLIFVHSRKRNVKDSKVYP